MRLLHLITRLILGGAQENTVLSCEGQAAAGHEVVLGYGPIYGPEGSLLERVQRSPVRCEELSGFVRPVHPWRDVQAYWQCRRLIRDVKPDVVHTHSSKAGVIGRAAAWAEQVPRVVHTIHGLPFHPYQGRLKNALYIASERWAARRCHRIVCVAEAMQRQALAAGVGRPDQYNVVYSGMEIEPFLQAPALREQTRAQLGIADDELVIGTVARLAELKGHDDLLDALGEWLKANRKVRLLWVGDGWWRDRLVRRIERFGLTNRVTLTGLLPPQRIPAMMAAMDMLVHPSYREGLARTLPQALLTGTAVVSYDCDGAGEMCIDHQTGRLVRTGDRDALREAVVWLAEHDEQRQAMGQRGRELARQRFDHHAMVEALQRVYEGVG